MFINNIDDSTSISDNYITSLAIDTKGDLWVGTKNGLNKYLPHIEGFSHYSELPHYKNGISNAYVRKLLVTPKDSILWVETADGVLNMINSKVDKVKHFRHEKIVSQIYDYHSIYCDSEFDLWIGGRGFGPLRFDRNSEKFEKIQTDAQNPRKKRDSDIACIYQDSKLRYWMSATDGFYQYFPEKDEFSKCFAASTFDILESDSDKLWLATGSGLYLFNSEKKEFFAYKHMEGNNRSIASNHINCIFIDANKNLWVGTRKGISILHFRENIFKNYRHIPNVSSSLKSNNISCLLQDSDKDIWVGTMGGGLHLWDTINNGFSSFDNEFVSNRISCLYQDSYNDIWIGLWSGRGFYKLLKDKKQFKHYAFNYKTLKSDWYRGFLDDRNGRFWVAYWGANGVHFFNREDEKFEPYYLNLNEAPLRKPAEFIEIQDEYIWNTSSYSYIYRYNSIKNEYTAFVNASANFIFPKWRTKNNIIRTNYKPFQQITCIYKSTNNTLLFATNNGLIFQSSAEVKHITAPWLNNISGITNYKNNLVLCSDSHLVVIDPKLKLVKSKVTFESLGMSEQIKVRSILVDNDLIVLGTNYGLYLINSTDWTVVLKPANLFNNAEVNDIVKNGDGACWLATDKGLIQLEKYNLIKRIINTEHYFKQGFLSNNTNAILIENDTVIWFGSNKGLTKFNVEDNLFFSIPEFLNLPVYDIKTEDNINFWLATENGIAQYNTITNTASFHYKKSNHQLSSRLTQFIHQDKKGMVWIGTTQNGLNRIDTTTFNIEHFLSNELDSTSIWGNHITCMLECKDGSLIFGGKGLNIYDSLTNGFNHITTSEGLVSDEILAMVEDQYPKIWILTSAGLLRYNRQTNTSEVFEKDWGLIPHEFNMDMKKINSGEILIASDVGLYVFHPNQLDSVFYSENIEIIGFKIFDKKVRNDFTKEDKITLNYDQNFFTIEFSDFNFSTSNTGYTYKLYGVDKNWVSSFERNFASYTNIPHGKYTFSVTTKHNLISGIPPKEITIVITPPFWKTYWFITLEALVALSVVMLVFYIRTKRFKLREKHLVLEQKLLRSQMNPHFVFNALTAIQSFVFKNNPKEAGRYLSKFAKLMRLFLQNTRHEFIPMSQELETLVYYMELQRLRFNNSFDFDIQCSDQFDPELIKIPPMMAQPFIENAIEHGFKSINYSGKIDISYQIENEKLRIVITDNGVGINQTVDAKLKKNHTSLATTITRERLESFSNKKQVYSLKVEDLNELDINGNGTRIIVEVPYKSDF